MPRSCEELPLRLTPFGTAAALPQPTPPTLPQPGVSTAATAILAPSQSPQFVSPQLLPPNSAVDTHDAIKYPAIPDSLGRGNNKIWNDNGGSVNPNYSGTEIDPSWSGSEGPLYTASCLQSAMTHCCNFYVKQLSNFCDSKEVMPIVARIGRKLGRYRYSYYHLFWH